jgi:flagellar operon protein
MVERLNPAGIPPVPGQDPVQRPQAKAPGREARPFAEVLHQQLLQTAAGVKFSAHAVERLRLRAIELSPAELAGLDSAVKRAEAKGARESLVLSEKAAFVVSVKNRTVITVVDAAHMKENVFTNIDSAVIL